MVFAFDVYGTLIDTSAVFETLEKWLGPKATNFVHLWRNKQLEYSFRRGLMEQFVDFSVVTKQALLYCCQNLKVPLSENQKEQLLEMYTVLPAFPDVVSTIEALNKLNNCRIVAFSNGRKEAVEKLLKHAGVDHFFEDIISCATVQMFKPAPKVYEHLIKSTNADPSQSLLISGNPFDILGAMNYGLQGAWVQRDPSRTFDPWGITPTITMNNLLELVEWIDSTT